MRLLVPGATEGQTLVEGARFHHLIRVLRARVGDSLEVFDGEGRAFDAQVTHLTQTAATLVLSAGRSAPRARRITIVQGLPKAEKLEWVLQKGTELGAAAFAPAACSRSVVKLDGKEQAKQARWQKIVEEAARQCGRAEVPVVHVPRPLKSAVTSLDDRPFVLVLDEEERAATLTSAVAAVGDGPLALVVGPEGGLSREEVAELVNAGAVPVSLGRLILRTETAALAALAVLRHLEGELG